MGKKSKNIDKCRKKAAAKAAMSDTDSDGVECYQTNFKFQNLDGSKKRPPKLDPRLILQSEIPMVRTGTNNFTDQGIEVVLTMIKMGKVDKATGQVQFRTAKRNAQTLDEIEGSLKWYDMQKGLGGNDPLTLGYLPDVDQIRKGNWAKHATLDRLVHHKNGTRLEASSLDSLCGIIVTDKSLMGMVVQRNFVGLHEAIEAAGYLSPAQEYLPCLCDDLKVSLGKNSRLKYKNRDPPFHAQFDSDAEEDDDSTSMAGAPTPRPGQRQQRQEEDDDDDDDDDEVVYAGGLRAPRSLPRPRRLQQQDDDVSELSFVTAKEPESVPPMVQMNRDNLQAEEEELRLMTQGVQGLMDKGAAALDQGVQAMMEKGTAALEKVRLDNAKSRELRWERAQAGWEHRHSGDYPPSTPTNQNIPPPAAATIADVRRRREPVFETPARPPLAPPNTERKPRNVRKPKKKNMVVVETVEDDDDDETHSGTEIPESPRRMRTRRSHRRNESHFY